ncbi:MAG: glycosyltransferase [Rhodospirillum sp.]|nr:glycosyltransferase [Rhodospirillum sp.]MCF8487636.1 glycosyltransferase [Rhodospirillum sp.]MCF8499240.1 glycosyltransferase [Rhodospirillum sp.]
MPLVTFLMPVYEGASSVAESVRSVFSQPGDDYDLLLVDDGSTDHSADLARSTAKTMGREERFRVLTNPENLGLVETLNRGLAACDCRYVARIDADDLCRPERFALQTAFMAAHPEVGLLGGAFVRFGAMADIQRVPESDEAIRAHMVLDNAFGHGTVMIRREILEREDLRYDPERRHVEDYDLWVRLARVTHVANLPNILMDYRVHDASLSSRHAEEQAVAATLVSLRDLAARGIAIRQMDVEVHHQVRLRVPPADGLALLALHGWLRRVRTGLLSEGRLSAAAVDGVLLSRYRLLTNEALRRGWIAPQTLEGLEDLAA